MKQFKYRAKSLDKGYEEGHIWAETKEEAKLRLHHQRYFILSVEEVRRHSWLWERKKWSTKSIIHFSFQMGMLLEAGISIRTILDVLDSRTCKFPIREMKENLDGGAAVYEMLEQSSFPALGCTLIRAGEASGTLGNSFLAVKSHYEKLEEEKERWLQVLAYPAFVLVMMIAFFLGAVLFILPNFQTIFQALGAELPYTTKLLFRVGDLLREYWFVVLMLPVLLVAILFQAVESRKFRYVLDQYCWHSMGRTAWYGGAQYSRLFRVLGILLGAGIGLFDAITLVTPLCHNLYVREQWEQILLDLQGGKSMSISLRERGLATPIVYELVQAGELSGELDHMLGECGKYYEKEVEKSIQLISRWMEPVMMTVLGIGVGTLVLSVMIPLFQSVNQLGNV